MLEYSLIKQHRPRFNIRLRDDKSYPFMAITLDEEWPRALVMRGRKRKGVRYFGPYGHAYAIRDTLDLLLRTFPIRTCSPSKFRTPRAARAALPAVPHREVLGAVRRRDRPRTRYDELVQELIDFLDGDTDGIVRKLTSEMKGAAGELEFERAARLRDRLTAVQQGHRAPADGGRPQRGHRRDRPGRRRPRGRGADVLRPQGPGGRAQGLHRRQGRGPDARGSRGPHPRGALRRGAAPRACPSRCWCPVEPESLAVYEEWLCELRGSRVQVRVPQRGEKRELQETVTRNAKEEFTRHRLRRASDHNSRARALNELQDALESARGAAAHRVLRHGPHPGHRLRRLDGGARGRPAPQERVPPLQGARASTATTTSRPWRRCSRAGSSPTWRSATGR